MAIVVHSPEVVSAIGGVPNQDVMFVIEIGPTSHLSITITPGDESRIECNQIQGEIFETRKREMVAPVPQYGLS